jgi:hypothetical protein
VRPHKRSDAELNEPTRLKSFNANLNGVRVRPHKRSDAELNEPTRLKSFNANLNGVRVPLHEKGEIQSTLHTLQRISDFLCSCVRQVLQIRLGIAVSLLLFLNLH